jgi:hypothetical protein
MGIAPSRLAGLVLLAGATVVVLGNCSCTYQPYSPPPVAFAGDSSLCKQTAIVPTLDSPMPKGKNVIWCGTFQLAYDELKGVIGPLGGKDANGDLGRLNASRMNRSALPDGSFYAAGGRIKDGIIQKVRADMARAFPAVKPNLGGAEPSDASIRALAYAYLAANVKFGANYFIRERGDEFADSTGVKTPVSSFGLHDDTGSINSHANDALIAQIQILFADGNQSGLSEFALDLDRNSSPSQLILACVGPRETLAATWREVQRKMEQGKPQKGEDKFRDDDTLAVPNLNYQIQHSFSELEKADPLLRTFQSIDFRLDRSGAALASESFVMYKWGFAGGRRFAFTMPFLIVMRKRGAAEPYFVMWVDNAELLCKPPAVR